MRQPKIKQHAEIDLRFRFEKLLADISTFFINLPADRIDREIETAQRHVCEFLGIDRSALWQIADDDPDTFFFDAHASTA